MPCIWFSQADISSVELIGSDQLSVAGCGRSAVRQSLVAKFIGQPITAPTTDLIGPKLDNYIRRTRQACGWRFLEAKSARCVAGSGLL